MPSMHEKVYGCLAASRVASAMGAAVEGWSPERIRDTYGFVDRSTRTSTTPTAASTGSGCPGRRRTGSSGRS